MLRMAMSWVLASAVLPCVIANDPSGSWLSYAVYADPQDRRITMLNATWVVPSTPSRLMGSNAPGWWFGTQTAKGDGALVQPILAWGYQGDKYSIFNGVFDWTDGSWHTSPETQTVKPGDTVVSSLWYVPSENAYTMSIAAGQGRPIVTTYKLLPAQHANESTAYFVLEHQPDTCEAYPSDGVCTFKDIYMEVDGMAVTPQWTSKQEQPKCDSKATIIDSKTIEFTWSSKASSAPTKSYSVAKKWASEQ